MHILIIIFGGILGLIIGSFLNVVILRINTGKGLGGRSMCFSCNRTLSWYELIPVVSFFIQKGRCRKCHSKISWQYPLVELATGVLFAGVLFFVVDPFPAAIWLILVSLGMVISVYDTRHKTIPFYFLIAFLVVGLFTGVHILGLLAVGAPFLIIWIISKGRWIGFGDVEIMAVVGLMFGIARGYSAVIVSFWLACLVMVPVVLFFKWRKRKHDPQIPFGPFLLFGLYLVGITGFNLFSFITKVLQ